MTVPMARPSARRVTAILLGLTIVASSSGTTLERTTRSAPTAVSDEIFRARSMTVGEPSEGRAVQMAALVTTLQSGPKSFDPFVLPAEIAQPPGIPCFSSASSTAPWVKVLYLYQSGTPNRLEERMPTIREAVALADLIYERSAARTGGIRHVRWKMTSSCKLAVVPVAMNLRLPMNSARDYLVKKGLLKLTEKGLAFREGTSVVSGLGQHAVDSRPSSANRNNRGGTLAWVYLDFYADLWGDEVTSQARMFLVRGHTAAHELAHTLGAVQPDAPHGHGAHCWDDYDVMCQEEPGGKKLREVCPATILLLFDCKNDDYFHTSPKPGSYLATHWNIARSRYLATRSTSRWDQLARPTVALRGVNEGSSLTVGTALEIAAGPAADSASVAAVSLLVNDRIVDIDREAPFWLGFYPGGDVATGTTVRLTVMAYDDHGRRALTPPITTTVADGAPGATFPAPTSSGFEITAPVLGAVTGSFAVRLMVSDPSIAAVAISVNGAFIGQATAPDWVLIVNPVALGAAFGDELSIVASATGADGVRQERTTIATYLPP